MKHVEIAAAIRQEKREPMKRLDLKVEDVVHDTIWLMNKRLDWMRMGYPGIPQTQSGDCSYWATVRDHGRRSNSLTKACSTSSSATTHQIT